MVYPAAITMCFPPVAQFRLRVAAAASGVALILLTLLSCDGGTHIDGVAKNRFGMPLNGVQITLAQGTRVSKARSDSDGRFKVGMTHAPFKVELKLSGAKDGYKPFDKTFTSSDHIRNIVINMEEAPEPSLADLRQQATKGTSAAEATQLAVLMCGQLPNSAAFPVTSQLSGDDVHDTLVLLGTFSVPCLIDHITDYQWMPDPRSEPMWGDFRAGDAAFFILCDAGVDFDSVVVPMVDKKQWEGIGVFAYFEWINMGHHRKLLQEAVRRWVEQHPLCCGSEADVGAAAHAEPAFTMTAAKLSELQHRLAQLKPGMSEGAVRQSLGAPDLESNLETIDNVIDFDRSEKSAAIYFVERQSDVARSHGLNRDFLRDRYVIVFFTEQGKFVRVFSNVQQLPPIIPQNRALWLRLMYGGAAHKAPVRRQ